MSEHKTGLSSWTAEEKKLYRERREKGLRGQTGAVTVHQSVLTKDAGAQKIPLGNKLGAALSRGKSDGQRAHARHPEPTFVKTQRKATGRGE